MQCACLAHSLDSPSLTLEANVSEIDGKGETQNGRHALNAATQEKREESACRHDDAGQGAEVAHEERKADEGDEVESKSAAWKLPPPAKPGRASQPKGRVMRLARRARCGCWNGFVHGMRGVGGVTAGAVRGRAQSGSFGGAFNMVQNSLMDLMNHVVGNRPPIPLRR